MKIHTIVLFLLSTCIPLRADYIVLFPTQDRDVYEGSGYPTSSSTNLGVSNSSWTGEGGHSQRSVIQFDVTSANTGITSAQVTKATLGLYILPKLEAYPIDRPIGGDIFASIQTIKWSETGSPELYWNMLLNPGELLDTLTLIPDRDYPFDNGATTIYETEIWVEFDVTSAVIQWLNGSVPNFGILLWPNEDPSQSSGVLFADSSGGLTTSPFLKIEYADEQAAPELKITSFSMQGNQVTLVWDSRPGISYAIKESSDLSSWETLHAVSASSASTTFTFTGTSFEEGRAFYVVAEIPAGE